MFTRIIFCLPCQAGIPSAMIKLFWSGAAFCASKMHHEVSCQSVRLPRLNFGRSAFLQVSVDSHHVGNLEKAKRLQWTLSVSTTQLLRAPPGGACQP